MTQSRRRLPRDPVTLNFKPGLRARVHAVAEAEQRTFTETVNNLVERGLAADQRLIDGFGSVAGYTMARSIIAVAEAAALEKGAAGGRWVLDAEAYQHTATAISQMLPLLGPGKLRDALAQVEAARQRASG